MNGEFLQFVLKSSLGTSCELIDSSFVSGGCINNTMKLDTSKGAFFIKWKQNEPDLFKKEALGLELLKLESPIFVPDILGKGEFENNNFLLLEYIKGGARSESFWLDFGQNLARQHQITQVKFGLDHDNHIGRLPQQNSWKESWIDFFIEMRLEPQLKMAEQNHLVDFSLREDFEQLYKHLSDFSPNEPPSLLHGDLWSGNFMTNSDGDACIFDPAVYYGHREMELSFTRMFGGFDSEFYRAYSEKWSLETGFEDRVDIYNLYPLLVHLNLFGTSYLPGIQQTLKRFR